MDGHCDKNNLKKKLHCGIIKRNVTATLSVLNVLKGECSISEAIIPSALVDLVRTSNSLYGWTGNNNISGDNYLELCGHLQAMEDICENPNVQQNESAVVAIKVLRSLLSKIKPSFLRTRKTSFAEETSKECLQ